MYCFVFEKNNMLSDRGVQIDYRMISKATSTDVASTHFQFAFSSERTKLRFRDNQDETFLDYAYANVVDKWTHFVVGVHQQTTQIWIDGTRRATKTRPAAYIPNTDVAMAIGNQPLDSDPRGVRGLLDELLFLSVDDVRQDMSMSLVARVCFPCV
jgi:hypothetical protein